MTIPPSELVNLRIDGMHIASELRKNTQYWSAKFVESMVNNIELLEQRVEKLETASRTLADAAYAMSAKNKDETELDNMYYALNNSCAAMFTILEDDK